MNFLRAMAVLLHWLIRVTPIIKIRGSYSVSWMVAIYSLATVLVMAQKANHVHALTCLFCMAVFEFFRYNTWTMCMCIVLAWTIFVNGKNTCMCLLKCPVCIQLHTRMKSAHTCTNVNTALCILGPHSNNRSYLAYLYTFHHTLRNFISLTLHSS